MLPSASPWTPALQPCPSFTISQSLLKLMSVMPSNHLHPLSPSSLLLLPSIFPSIRGFSNELALCIRWPKYWSLSFSNSPSNEYSGLIFFRIDCFDLLAVQGTLKSLLQHYSFWKYWFFSAQPSLWSNSQIHTWLLEKQPKKRKKFFCWSIIDLQCRVNFCCITSVQQKLCNIVMCVVYIYISIMHIQSFCILFHYGLSQGIEYTSLCCVVGPYCLAILQSVAYICEHQPPSPSLI